jgi:hypothetical protein
MPCDLVCHIDILQARNPLDRPQPSDRVPCRRRPEKVP